MTELEILEDNLEDAEFALMMAAFAEYRGMKMIEENERLKADPTAAVPEAITKKNLNLIHREISKRSRNITFRGLSGKFLRFLAAAALAALLFTAAYALSSEFRAGTLNILMHVDEKMATIKFAADESSDGLPELCAPEAMPTVSVGWVPEGYTGQLPISDRLKTVIDYTNTTGSSIQVRVHTESQSIHLLDTEGADSVETLTIQSQPALLITKNNLNRIVWADAQSNLLIYVESEAIDADTLKQVAESIILSW